MPEAVHKRARHHRNYRYHSTNVAAAMQRDDEDEDDDEEDRPRQQQLRSAGRDGAGGAGRRRDRSGVDEDDEDDEDDEGSVPGGGAAGSGSAARGDPFRPATALEERCESYMPSNKRRFNRDEVRAMLADALSHQDAVLREEFSKYLGQRLQEQFEEFSNFNRNYMDRAAQSRPPSYFS